MERLKRLFSGLRFRLILLVLLAVIPSTGLILYSAIHEQETLSESSQRELLRLVHEISARQDFIIEHTRWLLTSLPFLSEVRQEDAEACSALFAQLIQEYTLYANLLITKPNGDLWCSALPTEKPVNYADRAWFQEVMRARHFVVGGFVMGKVTGKPLMTFAYPLLDEAGMVQKVIVAGLDLGWLDQYLTAVPLPEGTVLTVLDRDGIILARTQEAEKWVGQTAPEAEIIGIALKRGEQGIVEATGVDGVQRLYAFVPLAETLPSAHREEGIGYVIAGIPTLLVYADAQRTLWFNLAALGMVTLLALAAAWVGGDVFLVRRVRALLLATRRMTQGELSARSGIPYGASEISQLARAFDEMAETLEGQHQQREQALLALRESEQRLEHLFTVSPAVIYTLDPGSLVPTWVSQNLSALLGYSPEEALQPDWWTQFVHPQDREQAQSSLHRLLAEGHLVHEYRFHKKNGDILWVRDELQLLRDEQGNPVEIVGAWTDITERKQAEERIAQQLETLIALYRGAQSLVETLDQEALARQVVRTCVETLDLCCLAWLGRAQEDGRVKVIAQFPQDHPYPTQINVRWDETPEGQGPTGRAIRNGHPEVVTDILSDPHSAYWRSIAEAYGFRSSAALPLISRGHTFGSLNLYSDTVGFFTPERLDTFQALASLVAAAMENARLYAEAQRYIRHVQALRSIDMAITASLDPRLTLRILLEEVTSQLEVDAAAVLLLNQTAGVLEYAAGRGFSSRTIEKSRLRLGEGYAGRAALERSAVSIADVTQMNDFVRQPLLREEGFFAYAVAPMIAKGRVLGVLETFHRKPLETDSEWRGFLEALAAQAAIAIENAQLFSNLEQSNIQLRLAYDATIEGWSYALDLRDKETEGHTQRVTELTVALAREAGMSEEEIVHVRRGALLHDIGKMGVPDGILLKPGPLTDEEWEIMRKHPQLAYEMLSPIEYLRPALDIPYCHHEKWDGTGYPRRLRGTQIPLAARLFAVADVWDALTNDRPYRRAWTKEAALEYIRSQSGKHFDPQAVELFLKILAHQEDESRF